MRRYGCRARRTDEGIAGFAARRDAACPNRAWCRSEPARAFGYIAMHRRSEEHIAAGRIETVCLHRSATEVDDAPLRLPCASPTTIGQVARAHGASAHRRQNVLHAQRGAVG